jgi:hypothetical protein
MHYIVSCLCRHTSLSLINDILIFTFSQLGVYSEDYAVENRKQREDLQNSGIVFVDHTSFENGNTNKSTAYIDNFVQKILKYLKEDEKRKEKEHEAYLYAVKFGAWKQLFEPAKKLVLSDSKTGAYMDRNELCVKAKACQIFAANIEVQHFVEHSTWHYVELRGNKNEFNSALNLYNHLASIPNMTQVSIHQSMKMMQNVLFRCLNKVVLNIRISYGNTSALMPIRFGDNIDAIASILGSNNNEKKQVKYRIKNLIGGADAMSDWISRRENNDIYSNTWLYNDAIYDTNKNDHTIEKVLIVFTTCRRVDKFLKTADALIKSLQMQGVYSKKHIENIIVIDDQSSDHDREKMHSRFPDFVFVYKKPEHKGVSYYLHFILNSR